MTTFLKGAIRRHQIAFPPDLQRGALYAITSIFVILKGQGCGGVSSRRWILKSVILAVLCCATSQLSTSTTI